MSRKKPDSQLVVYTLHFASKLRLDLVSFTHAGNSGQLFCCFIINTSQRHVVAYKRPSLKQEILIALMTMKSMPMMTATSPTSVMNFFQNARRLHA